jgi:hypothetical protein
MASCPRGSDESFLMEVEASFSGKQRSTLRQCPAILPGKLLHGSDLQGHNHFIPKSYGIHCPFPSAGGKLNDSEDDSDPACGTERT